MTAKPSIHSFKPTIESLSLSKALKTAKKIICKLLIKNVRTRLKKTMCYTFWIQKEDYNAVLRKKKFCLVIKKFNAF